MTDRNKIKPRRSYTSGYVPTSSDLEANELAINWADGKAFTKDAAGQIVSVTMGGSGGGGSGLSWSSVPASATATGTAGSIAYDGSYLYVATAANTWVRAALSTWTNWTPASLSGLSLWLDASDASSLYDATSGGSLATADGTVRRWQDKSGNARHATGSAGPTRKAASINSLDALLFNGSTNGLSVAGNLYGTSGYITMFAVVRKASVNTTAMIASQDNSNVSPRTYQFLRVGDTALQGIWFTSGPNTRVASATATVSANTTFLATLRIGSSGGAVSLNGAAGSVVSDTSNILTTSENTYIGSYAYTGNEWDGHICELVAYDTALSDANKATVESYLMTKWGIA